jgi:TolB protein
VPHAPPAAFDPAFSPDGRSLVFDDGQQSLDNGQQAQLYRMRVDGTGLRRIGVGRSPDFSPRGGRIAFSADTPGGGVDVYSARPNGSDVRDLTPDPAGDVDPSYSPDGRLIAFTGLGIVGYDQIYVMRANGTHVRRLTNDHAHDNRPVFSPDGRKIAFVVDGQHTHTDIYVMDRDGTHQRKLTRGPAYEYLLDWQPLPPRPRR